MAKHETTRALLDAATAALRERRPTAINGRQLAGQANVAYAQIYHHFGTKDDLLLQALTDLRDGDTGDDPLNSPYSQAVRHVIADRLWGRRDAALRTIAGFAARYVDPVAVAAVTPIEAEYRILTAILLYASVEALEGDADLLMSDSAAAAGHWRIYVDDTVRSLLGRPPRRS